MGTKLVRREGVTLIAALLLMVACAGETPSERSDGTAGEAERLVARSLEWSVSAGPPGKAWKQRLVTASDRVRVGGELDQWRLFDFSAGTVTWIDEIDQSFRTVPISVSIEARRRLFDRPLPPDVPRATITEIEGRRSFAGLEARGFRIEMGAYTRELWISVEPIAPKGFLAAWLATEPLHDRYAAVMREPFRILAGIDGVPLHDSATLPLGSETLTYERTATGYDDAAVIARALLTIPESYADSDREEEERAGDRRPAS